MTGKIFKNIVLMGVLAVGACSQGFNDWNNSDNPQYFGNFAGENMSSSEAKYLASNPNETAKVYNKRVPEFNSLIVCRDKQCASAQLAKSKEYIFNSIAHIIDNNIDSTALLCEANPQAHVCTNPYLTIPARIGVTPAYVYLDSVKIVDASISKGKTALDLILAYNLSYNGQSPNVCKPDTALMYVKSNNDVVLNGNGFACDMTSVGKTTIKVMFDIDYIDLDYGYIGGYYSIGLSGPATGGGSGYGIIRLQNDTHPLNPELMMEKEPEIQQVVIPTRIVRPELNINLLQNSQEAEVKEDEAKELEQEAVQEEIVKVSKTAQEEKVATYGVAKKDRSQDELEPEPEDATLDITEDTVVSGDKLILQTNAKELRPFEVEPIDNEPKTEEIKIDDYIQ